MPLGRRGAALLAAGIAAGLSLLLGTAWLNVQSVRWGYKSQALRARLDDLEKREQVLDRRLQSEMSLGRLDQLAKAQFGLKVPRPSQIFLLPDPAGGEA